MSERAGRLLADELGVPYVPLEGNSAEALGVERAALATLEPAAARSFAILPLTLRNGVLVVATADPRDPALTALGALAGIPVQAAVADASEIARAQDILYGAVAPARHLAAEAAPAVAPESDLRERRLTRDLARRADLPFVSLEPTPSDDGSIRDPIDPDAARRLSEAACRALGVIPIATAGDSVAIATSDPTSTNLVEAAGALAGMRAWVVIAPAAEIERAIFRVFGAPEGPKLHLATPAEGQVAPPAAIDPVHPDNEAAALSGALLASGTISAEELARAVEQQARHGDHLGHVITHSGMASEREVAATLARLRRQTFTDPAHMPIDPEVAQAIPENVARRHGVVPLARVGDELVVASEGPLEPHAISDLERHAGGPIRVLAAPSTSIDSMLGQIHSERNVDSAANFLRDRRPEDSALRVLSRRQAIFLIALVLLGIVFTAIEPLQSLIVFNIAAIVMYFSVVAYRFRLVYHSLGHEMALPVSDEEIAALDERDLPIYTILVPLYKEPQMLPHLVDSLSKLDYPPPRLDIKIILESDDEETREALEKLDLPPHFRLVIVPDAEPKTKPKACNYALTQARGTYVVIYDAEDEPEPDQLKKAVVAFSKADPEMVCMQCKLNYFNQRQNLLTRWFTTEYSLWFDLLLPGLDATDAPIPLGGTSNHFVTANLLEVGAWDPFNVTEDADLGLRLYKNGFRAGMIDSTTYEEANSELLNWIRQRSRWVKGYMQTWLVQMRHPIRLRRELGWRGWLSFQLTVGGTPAIFLLNPIYWLLTTAWLMTEAGVIRSAFPGLLFYIGGIGFYIGNFLLAYMAAAGSSQRNYHDLVKYAMFVPIYWVLMSIGAWKGFLQLLFKPHYWEKTEHGLHLEDEEEPPTRAGVTAAAP